MTSPRSGVSMAAKWPPRSSSDQAVVKVETWLVTARR
jgi:hypothetical protein